MKRGQKGGLGGRLQNEIENFLAEVTGSKTPAQRKEEARQQQERRARQLKQKQKQQTKRTQQEQQQRKKRTPPRRRQVGSGISEHVDEYINQHVAEHIDNDVEEYVEATIVDSVEDHLGNRKTEMPRSTATAKKESPAKEVAALLRDPGGVRNAILINEILSRPAVLRRK